MLRDRVGEVFDAVATDLDEKGVRLQLRDLPILARVDAAGVVAGDTIRVRLQVADPAARRIGFALA